MTLLQTTKADCSGGLLLGVKAVRQGGDLQPGSREGAWWMENY